MATADEPLQSAMRHHLAGNLPDAEKTYRHMLQMQPNDTDALWLLGLIAYQAGKPRNAAAIIRQVQASPLGAAPTVDSSKPSEARGEAGSRIEPGFSTAYVDLGDALGKESQLDEAVACFRKAIELRPNYPEAHNRLGHYLKNQGQIEEAIASFQKAVELRPDYAKANSNLLYLLHFSPRYSARAIYDRHQSWALQVAAPLEAAIRPHDNIPLPDRRLRVGYVSAGFCRHVAAFFLIPMLEAHDHEQFEIFCYSSVGKPDELTERFRSYADGWRETAVLGDAQLAELIRQDRIDVLVDLTLHMAGSRLLAFARKPAPVQVTYLGYPSTTGLSTMDYRITDPYLDPENAGAGFYSEKSIRLPETWWCYRPIEETPQVNALPALQAGHVTFGSLNNFFKITPQTLSLWCEVLRAVPHSRLTLLADEGSHRERVRRTFQNEGVAAERVQFVGPRPFVRYMELYHRIDIGLDPFPANGHTTTCDSLWMGVPVVTLPGETAISRGALSLLSNVGLKDLAAGAPGDYVRIAASLAGDLPRLSAFRSELRTKLGQSPVMDAPRFTRNLEDAYRRMWISWCFGQRPT